MKKQVTSILVFIILVSAVFFFSLDSTVSAAPSLLDAYSDNLQASSTANECTPFDVLFLVDQSSSMSASNGVMSDPDNQRIEAVKWAIEHIGFVNLNACQNDVIFRLGVVPFGGEVDSQDIPFTNINPIDDVALDSLLSQILPALEPKDLGATDFALAFDKANDMFDALPLSQASGGDHQRAIIVITDGTACSADMSDKKVCNSSKDILDYMGDLERKIISDFDIEEFYLYIIGINRYDDLNVNAQRFYQDNAILPWERITSSYLAGSGYRQLGEHQNDIPAAFVDVVENLSGITGDDISCDPLPVEPYLEMVQLNIFRNTDLSPVQIKVRNVDNDETVFILGERQPGWEMDISPEYSVHGLNEMYLFRNPIPGNWIVTMDDTSLCDELRGQFISIAATSEKIAPIGGLPQNPDKDITGLDYDEGAPYFLEYRIVDRLGNSLPDYGGRHHINANVSITSPSGILFSRQLEKSSDPGVWKTDLPLPTSELGIYTYSLVGTTRNLEGSEDIVVIEAQEGTYEVSQPVERFSWHIAPPQASATSPTRSGYGCWTNPNNVVLDIFVTEYVAPGISVPDLKHIDSRPIFASEDAFSIDITDPAGNLLDAASITIKQINNATDPGHYQVHILGSIMDQKGTYEIRVNRISAVNPGWGERISPDINNFLEIRRTEGFMTGENSCTVSIVILALIGAILLGFLIYWTTGKPKGFLHFLGPDNNEVLQLSVTGSWRKTVLGKNRLGTIRPYVDLAKIIIWRDGSVKEHNSTEEGSPSIKITIHGIEDGEKVTFAEDETIHDQDEVFLANHCSVIYTRKGVIN